MYEKWNNSDTSQGRAAVTVCVGTCLNERREPLAGVQSAAWDNEGQ